MNQIRKYLWGIILIALGVIIGLNVLEITDINIFFEGWWTLFIIVPCFIGLFEEENKTGDFIGLMIGVALLLSVRGMIEFSLLAKLFVPFILVVIGLSMIFNEAIKSKITKKVNEGKQNGLPNIVATFAGQKVVKDEEFKGANLDAVFGGIQLDLRSATLNEETIIKASSIFGGITIIVPKDVNVKVKSTPIFGGVSNKNLNRKENTKTIYIDAFCMFGGVDIR